VEHLPPFDPDIIRKMLESSTFLTSAFNTGPNHRPFSSSVTMLVTASLFLRKVLFGQRQLLDYELDLEKQNVSAAVSVCIK
jgi:hypothetical protein